MPASTEVVNEVFDLFAALDATDEQLDFPIIYGSAKQGWMADTSPRGRRTAWGRCSTSSSNTCRRRRSQEGGFRMLGTLLEANPYLGRIITGRVFAGSVKPNQSVKVLDRSPARSSSRGACRRSWRSAVSSGRRSTRRKPAISSPSLDW